MSRMAPMILFLPLIAACGARQHKQTNTALSIMARAVVEADTLMSEAYTDAHLAAMAQCRDRDCYDAKMSRWNRGAKALEAASVATLVAYDTHMAVLEGQDGDALGAAVCAAEAIGKLVTAMASLGVEIPDKIDRAIEVARQYTDGQCRGAL